MKTNKIIIILTMIVITIGLLIGATQQTSNLIETTPVTEVIPTNAITESTNDFYLEPNNIAIEYNNGTYEVLEVEFIGKTETGTLYNLTDGTGYYIGE